MITQWYQDLDPVRAEELMKATCENINNPHITRIHFLESLNVKNHYRYLMPHCNVTLGHFVGKTRFYNGNTLVNTTTSTTRGATFNGWMDRLTAGTAFEFASKYLPGKTAVLTNFDIYFDSSLRLLKMDRWLSLSNMYFLSRYEAKESTSIGTQCGPGYIGSHDSFVFIGPLPKPLINRSKNLPLGMPGMENRLIYDFRRFGIRILNPCKSIRSWHSHKSGVKNQILPLANTDNRSGIVKPSYLVPNPALHD